MKSAVQLAVLSTILFTAVAEARVIYGVDNRKEVYEGSLFEQKLAMSAATLVPNSELTIDPTKPDKVQLTQRSLKDWLESQFKETSPEASKRLTPKALEEAQNGIGFCSGVRYTEQPNPGMCSGFLIAPDLILTAGHCTTEENFCSDNSWVFGFQVDPKTKVAGVDISAEDVYKCKKVMSNTLMMSFGLDYSLVQLDRPVKNRMPLEIRNDKLVAKDAPLLVIGSPSGLPLKIAGGAKVRDNDHPFFFSANLDTFQGNSGSGVFDAVTGRVEGILVRGEEDFKADKVRRCLDANYCADNDCRGEDVTRLTAVPEIGIQLALNEAASKGNLVNLQALLKLKTWVDFYGKDGVSALMKAAQNTQAKTIDLLIANGADVNLKDAQGNSSLHHLAVKLGPKSKEALNALLKAGAKLEERNAKGETALLVASKKSNIESVKLLIASGANKNAVDAAGESALFAFARKKETSKVKELIRLGVNPSIKNKKGLSYSQVK